eukprot:3400901-Amphidinium_carterae.1
MGNKKTQVPQTPSIPTLIPRLRLKKENFANDDKKQTDTFYEQRLSQEAIRRSYIQYLTTGYKATNKIRTFYDGFELYNWHDQLSPVKAIEDDRTRSSIMRQLVTTSHHYTNKFYDRIRYQDLGYMKERSFDANEMRRRVTKLRAKNIREFYIILPESTLHQWMTTGTIPPRCLENGTDEKHSWYTFYTIIKFAMGDFVNIYRDNHPQEFPLQTKQLNQTHYLVIVHTFQRLVREFIEDLKVVF